MPNNYSRGKVYKIVCRKTGKQYFGSTTEPTLARRLSGHIQKYNCWKKSGKYHWVSSFTIIENNDYYIELVELVSCSSKDELLVRERFHIENNDCVNKVVPLRTGKEYNNDNKIDIAEKRHNNKEKLNEYGKKYRDENKEKISEKNKEKITCECGSILRKREISIHIKTIKHKNYLKEQLGNAPNIQENNIII